MKMNVTNVALVIGLFILLVAPACAEFNVTGISPNSALNIGVQNNVQVTGNEFPPDASIVVLNMTGQANISGFLVNRISDTQMNCSFDLTGKQWGFWNVSVANGTLWSRPLPYGFDILVLPPVLSSSNASSGINTNSAFPITLTGQNFLPNAVINITNGSAMFNADNVSVPSSTVITCTLDLTSKSGLWFINVTNPDGQHSAASLPFMIYAPSPTITGVNPVSGVNSVGIPVNIRTSGTNILSCATVDFVQGTFHLPIEGPVNPNPTYIDANVNLSNVPVGFYNVTITNPGPLYNNTTSINQFQVFYLTSPAVTGINPASGPNSGVVSVNITGTGFYPGLSAILTRASHANITGTVNTVSPILINCNFPISGQDTGLWNVVVINNDTRSSNTDKQFNITNPKPFVLTITPLNGSNTNNALSAQITGTGFIDSIPKPVVALSMGPRLFTGKTSW